MVRPIGPAPVAPSRREWTPADEGADRDFVHTIRRWRGPLPRGPATWRDVCVLLAALSVCYYERRRLRPVPGHEPPRRRGGYPAKG